MMQSKAYKTLFMVGVIGLLIGLVGMGNRFWFGHVDMAYGSYVPWGLWVVFDLLFLGLASGAYLMVACIYVFGMKRFEHLAPVAVLTVLVSLLCQAVIISLDLGQPFRVYRFLVSPSFTSMLTWLVIFILITWLIYIPMFYLLIRKKLILWSQESGRKGKLLYRWLAFGKTAYTDQEDDCDQKWVRRLAWISIPIGICFFSVQGLFFGTIVNRPLWSSALTPVLFITTAFLSGASLLAILASVYDRDVQTRAAEFFGRLVRYLLVGLLFLEALRFITGYTSGNPDTVDALNLIVAGPGWWAFWIVHLLLGAFVPLYLLIRRPGDAAAVCNAAILIMLSILAIRYHAVIPDMAAYPLEGLGQTFIHPRLMTAYAPTIYEWLVGLWILSLWLVVFLLGIRWLPVNPIEKGDEPHVS
ncbi:MAG: NrfD/PsrC family molybdoenzyme membrane anchor subunit [Smithellaceae bacterium]